MTKENPRDEARKAAGFDTQQALADRLEVPRSWIANFEMKGASRRTPPPLYDTLIEVLIENKQLKEARAMPPVPEITTIELFLIAYHHALGDEEAPWSDLRDPKRQKHVDAALEAVSMLPRQFFFLIPGQGACHQTLDEVKASLKDEQRFADAGRAQGD